MDTIQVSPGICASGMETSAVAGAQAPALGNLCLKVGNAFVAEQVRTVGTRMLLATHIKGGGWRGRPLAWIFKHISQDELWQPSKSPFCFLPSGLLWAVQEP